MTLSHCQHPSLLISIKMDAGTVASVLEEKPSFVCITMDMVTTLRHAVTDTHAYIHMTVLTEGQAFLARNGNFKKNAVIKKIQLNPNPYSYTFFAALY